MNYKDFDTKEEAQVSSPIQLHKTDYNNYENLSHFIEQYNIAQQIIKECGNFYKSFLLSKLKTWTQIINLPYRNMLDFTETHTSKNRYMCLESEYMTNRIVDMYCHYIYGVDDIYWRDKSKKCINNKTIDELQKDLDTCKKDIDILKVELATAVRDNVPIDICKVFSYFSDSLKSKKKITKDNTYSWISVIQHIQEEYIDKKNIYYLSKMEKNNIQLDDSVVEWCKNQYNTTYKELNRLEDKEEVLKNSITNSRNNVKKQLQKEFEEKLKSYNLPSEVISPGNGHVFFHKNNIKRLNSSISWTYDTKYEPIISDKEFNNLMHDIEDYIIGKVQEYGLGRIFERDNSYFIIHKNKLEYFGTDISKVKINLSSNQTELICAYEEVEEHKAYSWPSDAPTIRTTSSYVITFNTSNNEVKSYDVNTDTEEIKNKYYRY